MKVLIFQNLHPNQTMQVIWYIKIVLDLVAQKVNMQIYLQEKITHLMLSTKIATSSAKKGKKTIFKFKAAINYSSYMKRVKNT